MEVIGLATSINKKHSPILLGNGKTVWKIPFLSRNQGNAPKNITSLCETEGLRGLTRGMFKFLPTQSCSGKDRAEARHVNDVKHISVSSISTVIFLFVLVWYQGLVRAWWIFSPTLSFHLKLEAALHLIPITLSHFKPLFIWRMLGPAVAANLHQIVTFTMLANSVFTFLLCSQCHRLLAITLFLENCNSPERLSCLASWTTLQTITASYSSTRSRSLRKCTCLLTHHRFISANSGSQPVL